MTLKASELRIGNIVCVQNEIYHPSLKDTPLEITSISEVCGLDGKWTYSLGLKHINQKPNLYYESYSQFIHFIRPILLTQEWLYKFSFIKDDSLYTFAKDNVVIDLDPVERTFSYNGFPVKYVHRLQNVYHSLI